MEKEKNGDGRRRTTDRQRIITRPRGAVAKPAHWYTDRRNTGCTSRQTGERQRMGDRQDRRIRWEYNDETVRKDGTLILYT